MKTFDQISWNTNNPLSGLYNYVGYVATTYRQVQNIDALTAARNSFVIDKPGYASLIKTVFQGAEVALSNMTALLEQATNLLSEGNVPDAAEMLLVFKGFNACLTQLSRMPGELGGCDDFDDEPLVLNLTDSPTYGAFLHTKKAFDKALLRQYRVNTPTDCKADSGLGMVMKHRGLGDITCQVQQFIAQADHDMRVWYNNLNGVMVDAQDTDYRHFVGTKHITEAIRHPHYGPETLMNPFRSFHIAPEIMAVEINEHLRFATDAIEDYEATGNQTHLQQAYEHLKWGNALFPCIQKCFDALAEGLSYAQYHKFRGNFGATSASESKAIARDLLKQLPARLGCAVVDALTGLTTNPKHPKATHDVAVALLKPALSDPNCWLWRLISQECVRLHNHVMTWYDGHFKLPILQVGSSPSLAGAKDAIQHNFNLQNRVREHNPLNPLVAARHRPVALNPDNAPANSLTAYINSDESFFNVRVNTIGAVNRSMLSHLRDGHPDFDRLKALQKEHREAEKKQDALEDERLINRSETIKRASKCPFHRLWAA
jgi:hypothetical protein